MHLLRPANSTFINLTQIDTKTKYPIEHTKLTNFPLHNTNHKITQTTNQKQKIQQNNSTKQNKYKKIKQYSIKC